jgi:hypothetical protein
MGQTYLGMEAIAPPPSLDLRNCKFERVASKSNSAKAVCPQIETRNFREFRENPNNKSVCASAFSRAYEWHLVCIGKRASWQ